ncbi:MAG: hypothetical protein QOE79_1291 [Sphingomonadales bacterium]|jgi:hypothetical protein|nr:hypothetical protein [Sphingomonadales bacterium]MEA3050044.1 hypothetical protein [Sphingomonadales bacterium]
MSEIDRRTVISLAALAGGGLALSACGNKPKPPSNTVGYCDLAGQSVRDLAPKPLGPVKSFTPDYICIVYMKFSSDMSMKVRRVYIGPLNRVLTPSEVESAASDVLAKLASGQSYNKNDKEDIEPLHMGSQQILVIYLDHDENKVRFKYNPSDYNDPNHNSSYDLTIRFVKYSANGSDQRHDNHSFFNIMKMAITTHGTPLKSGTAFRLDNWNTDEMGHQISGVDSTNSSTYYLHSMNIHFEVASPVSSGPQKWVPLIIDPDTGNMGMQP